MTSVAAAVVRHPAHVALTALAVGLALSPAPGGLALGAAALAAGALSAVGSPALALAAAGLLLAGSAAGQARLEALDGDERRLAATGALALDARAYLVERPRASRFGSAAVVRIASGADRGLRLYAHAPRGLAWPPGAGPGTEVRLAGSARALRPAEAGAGFDLAAHLRRRGVAGQLALRRVEATGGRRGGAVGALDSARRRAERAVSAGLAPRHAALARGFVLGQDEAVDPLLRADFRDAGLGHLLAVSGQNVMLLCALALPLLALAGAGVGARVAALLALIALYVPLAGAGPSLQRAAVMGAAGLVALAAGRAASRWYALLLAAAATLALQPRVIGDPGWQLSFAAVAGIALLAPGMRRRMLEALEAVLPPAAAGTPGADAPARTGATGHRRLSAAAVGRRAARPLAEGAAMTVAATLATLPLLAHHFGSVPLAGVPANLAALPAVAPVMWIGMAQAAVGQLAALPALAPLAAAAAAALSLPAEVLLGYVATVAQTAAEHGPPFEVALSGPATALAYAAAAVVLLSARRARRPAGGAAAGRLADAAATWRRLAPATRSVLLAAVALAAAVVAAAAASGPPPPSRLTVSFLDVGQGDATLVQHPGGGAVLFDAGPPEARVVRLLRRAGVRRLDAVVATHASRDHHGGLAELFERVAVGIVVDGGDGTADPSFRAAMRTASQRGARIVAARAGLVLRIGRLTVRVLSPPPRAPGPPPADPNPRAVVAVVSADGLDVLLSGDAESGTLLPLALPDVEVMKVPHHGSADEGLADVLRRARPEVAAIPVGENSYGHPAPSTLAALRAHVPHVHRTDTDGTVRVAHQGGRLNVETDR